MTQLNIRTGIGYDVHEFTAGTKVILGGVEIPFEKSLKGHSDADVLLHAIIDAVLGALAWDDIGAWFPDTDKKWKGVESSAMFRAVWEKATKEGWRLGNCDAVLVAERPKIRAHVQTMREKIAELFGATPEQVSVKATTSERLGFVGREEGMTATAIVLLCR